MEQTKALNALEPFLALSKTATAPRAAADLITRATSAPNTFIFAELLETAPIQALADSPDYAPHLELLRIFSYGTYAQYRSAAALPALAEPQARKLRQLSLLTLARDRSNLSYQALQAALDLPDAAGVEALVVSAVYAGLLHATLDPAREAVQVDSVAPLRDLAPGAAQGMLAALNDWSGRCTSTLADLEAQMRGIRAAAAQRQREQRAAEEKLQNLMEEVDAGGAGGRKLEPGMMGRRVYNKRPVMDVASMMEADNMDVDEPEEDKKRANKRKM